MANALKLGKEISITLLERTRKSKSKFNSEFITTSMVEDSLCGDGIDFPSFGSSATRVMLYLQYYFDERVFCQTLYVTLSKKTSLCGETKSFLDVFISPEKGKSPFILVGRTIRGLFKTHHKYERRSKTTWETLKTSYFSFSVASASRPPKV